MPQTHSIDSFLDLLLDQKHKGVDIPAQNRQQMKSEMRAALDKMISLKMFEQLTSAELTELQHLDENGSKDDIIQQYITDHINPKIKEKDVFLAQILDEFRTLYLG